MIFHPKEGHLYGGPFPPCENVFAFKKSCKCFFLKNYLISKINVSKKLFEFTSIFQTEKIVLLKYFYDEFFNAPKSANEVFSV